MQAVYGRLPDVNILSDALPMLNQNELVNENGAKTNNFSNDTIMNHKKWGNKTGWPTISTRISPQLRAELLKKHPNEGDISKVLSTLIEMYMKGRILGVKLT